MAFYAYVAVAGENGVRTYAMDPASGKLHLQRETAIEGGPSNLAVDPEQQFLYVGLRADPGVVSLQIDPSSGELTPRRRVSLAADPCCIATDRRGRFLLSAHYGGGLIGVHPIDEDRAVSGPPVEWRKTLPKAHCVVMHESNRFLFLPHVGESNTILQFLFDEDTGALTPNAVAKVDGYDGQGPRHYRYHPKLDVVYTSDEQGSAITAHHLDPKAGTLKPFQTVSTLPAGFQGDNSSAQIQITSSGRFIYVSNRGHDSITGFSIDEVTGAVMSLGQTATEPTPRAFNIDPTDTFLYAAGLGSNTLATYRIGGDGGLTPLETYPLGEKPMWVLILDL